MGSLSKPKAIIDFHYSVSSWFTSESERRTDKDKEEVGEISKEKDVSAMILMAEPLADLREYLFGETN